jgi:hypothetical protein
MELKPEHFRLMANLEGHERVGVGNPALIPNLEDLHALRMVDFDRTPLGPYGVLGSAALLPDGASALADWLELGGR